MICALIIAGLFILGAASWFVKHSQERNGDDA